MKASAQVRSDLYAALAMAFSPPGESFTGEGQDHSLVSAVQRACQELTLSELQGELEELERSMGDMRSAYGQGAVQRLVTEYTALFDVPGKACVYPYESVYREAYGQVMGACATIVMGCYQEEGLHLSPQFRDLPDHIAAELEFMAYLSFQEAAAWEEARWEAAVDYHLKQGSFLEEHLARWAPAFCRSVIAAAALPLYLCAANITQRFIAWDYQNLVTAGHSPAQGQLPQGWSIRLGEGCVLCEACVNACTPGALVTRLEGDELVLLLEAERCNGCGHCVTACPERAVSLQRSEDLGAPDGQRVLARGRQGVCHQCHMPLGPLPLLRKVMHSLEERGTKMAHMASLCPQCKAKRLTASRVNAEKQRIPL